MNFLYNYTLTPVNSNQLQILITQSSIASSYSYIETVAPDTLNIYTSRQLDGSEQTALNSIISNYVYEAPVIDPGSGGSTSSGSTVTKVGSNETLSITTNSALIVTGGAPLTVDGVITLDGILLEA